MLKHSNELNQQIVTWHFKRYWSWISDREDLCLPTMCWSHLWLVCSWQPLSEGFNLRYPTTFKMALPNSLIRLSLIPLTCVVFHKVKLFLSIQIVHYITTLTRSQFLKNLQREVGVFLPKMPCHQWSDCHKSRWLGLFLHAINRTNWDVQILLTHKVRILFTHYYDFLGHFVVS